MIACFSGRLREAEEVGREAFRQAVEDGDVEAQGTLCMQYARALLAQGKVVDAARFAGEAAALLRTRLPRHMLRTALATAARAHALAGDAPAARVRLAEIDGLGIAAAQVLGPEVLVARAWVELAEGRPGPARNRLEDAAVMARSGGAAVLEAGALHDLARIGHAKAVTARLAELARIIEGPLIGLQSDHASALARRNAEGLAAAANRFEAMGADLHAAEAAMAAAVAHRRAGRRRAGDHVAEQASQLVVRCQGARTPGLAAVEGRVHLSPREQEVARLAVSGLSNAEIASSLGVSVRTVANQLQHCYEKLGVTSRAELAVIVGGT